MKANKILSGANLELLIEALDSHIYWQLSDEHYRNDGYVRDPGADDAEAAAGIKAANKLKDRLERRRTKEQLVTGAQATSAEGERTEKPTAS